MDKGAIKRFAVSARNKLIAAVTQQAFELGITKEKVQTPESYEDGFQINGVFFRQEEMKQRELLIKKIEQSSFDFVMEEVAYTWFNRFIALRFMEVNDYLPTGIRLFSSIEKGKTEPDALTEVDLLIDDLNLDQEYIYELQDENNYDELFKYILIKQCNQLGEMIPLVFEEITGYTELLLPNYLLNEGSVIRDLVTMIDEKDWLKEVEIIGWLFQYYNSELKDEVFADLRKNKKITKETIPAATQLFTPRWIVQYMVDNSLGRLWMESRGDLSFQDKLSYYLESAKQPDDVLRNLEEIVKKDIQPESISFLDPSMGSGHVLIYAFDVLYQIYLSQGYQDREIPKLIIENNLYGLEIDDRATQLAYFALMMKGRQYNPRIFNETIKPNLLSIQESNLLTEGDLEIFIGDDKYLRESIETLIEIFRDAKLYGSIIETPEINYELLDERVKEIKESNDTNIFFLDFKEYSLPTIEHLIKQAKLMSEKYDVVVTNPPYMGRRGMNPELVKYLRKHFPTTNSDMFAVMMERIESFTKAQGFFSTVTMQSWMFLSSFEKYRNHLIDNYSIVTLTHMANMVMGIAFGTVASVFRKRIKDYRGVFQYIEYEDIVNDQPYKFPITKNRFTTISGDTFKDIPGSPIAYWASETVRKAFKKQDKLGSTAISRVGLQTGENNKFLRLWHEVNNCNIGFNYANRNESKMSKKRWFPYNKGGSYRKWYGNQEYLVDWYNDGYKIRNFKDNNGKLKSRPQNMKYYFKEGLTWSFISSSYFGIRYTPKGFLFDVGGSSMFPSKNIYIYLSYLTSKVPPYFLSFMNPTLNFQIGNVSNLPLPVLNDELQLKVNNLAEKNIIVSKSDWDSFETSWDFKRHPFVEFRNNSSKIEDAFKNWEQGAEQRFQTLKANEEELNRIFIDLYGLQDELTPEVEDKDVTVRRADLERDVKSFLSYLVGIMFGRYSLDEEGLIFAGGEFDINNYQTFTPDKENIIPITDEMYFEDDIVGRTIELIKLIFGEEHTENNLEFIADALTRRKNETARERIRRYFLREFYKDHVRMYQKRPIYWLVDSGRQDGFKGLIYLHRYKPDLLSRVRTQYLHPQIRKYEEEMKRLDLTLQSDVSQAEKARARKTKEKIEKQVIECRDYDQIIAHMAHQQIDLDLDDGVKVNHDKFQGITVPQGEGKKSLKANVFAKI